jgi:hypothetical protein
MKASEVAELGDGHTSSEENNKVFGRSQSFVAGKDRDLIFTRYAP